MERVLSVWGPYWFNDDWNEVARFCDRYGFDGIELGLKGMPDDLLVGVPHGLVRGVHLNYWYHHWLPAWLPGASPDGQAIRTEMTDTYRREMSIARRLGAQYGVCHIAYQLPST